MYERHPFSLEKINKFEISRHGEFSKLNIITDNPGQNIGDTFGYVVIFFPIVTGLKQYLPRSPTDQCCFVLQAFRVGSTLFWGRGEQLRGKIYGFWLGTYSSDKIIRM